MFLPNEYLVYEYGKELQREADSAALVRLIREDSPALHTRWMNRLLAMTHRRPQLAAQPTNSPKAARQTAALRRA